MHARIKAEVEPRRTPVCQNAIAWVKIEAKLKNLSNRNIQWWVQAELGEFWKAELLFRNLKELAIINTKMLTAGQRLISCKRYKSGGQAHQEIFNQFIVLPTLEMLSRINRIGGICRLEIAFHIKKSLSCRLWLLSVNNHQEHRFSWYWILKIVGRGSICL